jgi:hypothetical protein
MDYEKIDDILNEWAEKHNLHLHKKYKDEDVRSLELNDSKGNRYQLWVDKPKEIGQIDIHIWNFGEREEIISTEEINLLESLESAYLKLKTWINE